MFRSCWWQTSTTTSSTRCSLTTRVFRTSWIETTSSCLYFSLVYFKYVGLIIKYELCHFSAMKSLRAYQTKILICNWLPCTDAKSGKPAHEYPLSLYIFLYMYVYVLNPVVISAQCSSNGDEALLAPALRISASRCCSATSLHLQRPLQLCP